MRKNKTHTYTYLTPLPFVSTACAFTLSINAGWTSYLYSPLTPSPWKAVWEGQIQLEVTGWQAVYICIHTYLQDRFPRYKCPHLLTWVVLPYIAWKPRFLVGIVEQLPAHSHWQMGFLASSCLVSWVLGRASTMTERREKKKHPRTSGPNLQWWRVLHHHLHWWQRSRYIL